MNRIERLREGIDNGWIGTVDGGDIRFRRNDLRALLDLVEAHHEALTMVMVVDHEDCDCPGCELTAKALAAYDKFQGGDDEDS